jgi:cysteine-rich repeat protein
MKKRNLLVILILLVFFISGCEEPLFSKKVDIKEIFGVGDGLKSDSDESDHIYETKVITKNNDLVKIKGSSSEEKVLNYVKSNYEIDIKGLHLEKSVNKKDDKEFIYFIQKYKGIPVYNSRSVFFVKNGKLSFMKLNYYKIENLDVDTKIDKDNSLEKVKNDLRFRDSFFYPERNPNSVVGAPTKDLKYVDYGIFPEGYYDITGEFRKYDYSKISVEEIKSLTPESTELIVYPKNNKYHLTYQIDLPLIEELPAKFTYFVDANTGQIIDVKDNLMFYDVSGEVTGLEWEDPFTDGIQLEKPFSSEFVEIDRQQQVETDDDGAYYISGVSGMAPLYSYLKGSWVSVFNTQQDESEHSYFFSGLEGHNWNWNSDDGSYLDEESNVFYHVNRIHDYAVSIGADEMNFNMEANVNIDDHCNAYYSSDRSVNFFERGFYGPRECESTGIINDVILHEYGHGIIHELNPSLLEEGYYDESGNIHEALADYWACTINDNPEQGEGFYFGIENPLRICNSDDVYPDDYDPEPHSGCQILSGALWDIRESLGKEYLDPIIVDALRLQPIDYHEFLEALLIVDDENGNIGDGTPNIELICDGFLNHGVFSSYCMGFTTVSYVNLIDLFNTIWRAGEVISIEGSVSSSIIENFEYYRVEFREEGSSIWSDNGIELVSGGNFEVFEDVLGYWDTSEILESGTYILRLTLFTDSSQTTTDVNLIIDTTLKEGWPQRIEFAGNYWPGDLSPVISDLNNDGFEEIVVYQGANPVIIKVFNHNGTYFEGWPVEIESEDYPGGNLAPPTIVDYDGDGFKEIFVNGGTNIIYIYAWDGTLKDIIQIYGGTTRNKPIITSDLNNDGNYEIIKSYGPFFVGSNISVFSEEGNYLEGWPIEFCDSDEYSDYDIYLGCWNPPTAIGNFDDDGEYEIVVAGQRNVFENPPDLDSLRFEGRLTIYNLDGSVLEGFPVDYEGVTYNPPVVADIDDDGYDEIIVGAKGVNYIEEDGTTSWSFLENSYNQGLAIGDINQDGQLEIISTFKYDNNIYVLDRYGNVLPEFTQSIYGDTSWKGSPILINLDSGPFNELFVSSGSTYGYVFGFDTYNSEHLESFPKRIKGVRPHITTSDLDGDGNLELIASDTDWDKKYSSIYVWDLDAPYDTETMEWPMFQHDPQHTGNYNYKSCGDGIVQSPNIQGIDEECDDGNRINTDDCTNECKYAAANDGICWEHTERCGECFTPEDDWVQCDDCVGYSGSDAGCLENKICLGYDPIDGSDNPHCAVSCSSDFSAGCFYRDCPQEYNEITGYEADMGDPLATACLTLDPEQEYHYETWMCCALVNDTCREGDGDGYYYNSISYLGNQLQEIHHGQFLGSNRAGSSQFELNAGYYSFKCSATLSRVSMYVGPLLGDGFWGPYPTDANILIDPAAECDCKDSDCDGQTMEKEIIIHLPAGIYSIYVNPPSGGAFPPSDFAAYGRLSDSLVTCTGSVDCDDSNAIINPVAEENTLNLIDDNCDGLIDVI